MFELSIQGTFTEPSVEVNTGVSLPYLSPYTIPNWYSLCDFSDCIPSVFWSAPLTSLAS